mgnify:CR=1 FL=1
MTEQQLRCMWSKPLEPERVFPEGHQYHDRIWYDYQEGSYYDRSTDMFLTLEEVKAFGLPV